MQPNFDSKTLYQTIVGQDDFSQLTTLDQLTEDQESTDQNLSDCLSEINFSSKRKFSELDPDLESFFQSPEPMPSKEAKVVSS